MKKIFLLILILSFSVFSKVEINVLENSKILIENEFFSITIAPDFGAQVINLFNKITKKQIIPNNGKIGGLFSDHDFRQYWPGEAFSSKYDYQIIEKSENKVMIEFYYNFKGNWRGQIISSLEGIIIRKRYIIYSQKPFVDLEIKIQNPTDNGKDIIYWVQNFISGDGEVENDLYYRPSQNGIIVEKGKRHGIEWIYEPISGWSGVIDKETKNGVIFLIDYNYLDTLYNCLSANTIEWIYDYVSIPSKKEWKTDIRMVLTNGMTNYSYASKNLIFGIEIEEGEENKINIEYQIQAVEKEIKDCKIRTIYTDMGEKPRLIFDTTRAKVVKIGGEIKEKDTGYFKISNIGFLTLKKGFSIIDENKGQKVLKLVIEGDDFIENFEIPFVYGKGIEPFYEAEIPLKKKIILKPDKIKLNKNGKLDVLYVNFGSSIERERFNIENILEDANLKICKFYKDQWKDKGEIENFPVSYEEILNYDLIILQSSFNCLGEIREEMIKDFVENGGCLLIFGGYFSYGKSDIRQGTLSEIMPFKIISSFDFKKSEKSDIKAKNGFSLKELFKNESFHIYWYHKVEPKKESNILIEIDGAPLLIEKKFGKGKILCFTGTFLGNKSGKQIPFWEWKNYKEFIKNLISYAVGGEI